MQERLLKKKYAELIKEAKLANGRKETVSFFHKAETLRNKISKKIRKGCTKCNGYGYRRTSLDGAKTCLECYGKGFLIKTVKNS